MLFAVQSGFFAQGAGSLMPVGHIAALGQVMAQMPQDGRPNPFPPGERFPLEIAETQKVPMLFKNGFH
ncbi:hypothetical protein [Pseudomonas aeruginosa]|uniref:hypothetical protein n=1 Tax=Pseudomonas aeruginosa TaxID=287 RepID=UPI00234A8A67|nr:hypothetical protein [Pseudomonas aeruginosa]